MPLGPGVRYRTIQRGGHNIRLAYRGKATLLESKDIGPIDKAARRRVKARHAVRRGKTT